MPSRFPSAALSILVFAACRQEDPPASSLTSFNQSPVEIRLRMHDARHLVAAALGDATLEASTGGPFVVRLRDGHLVNGNPDSYATEGAPAVCAVSAAEGRWACIAAPPMDSLGLVLRIRGSTTPLTADRCRALGDTVEVHDLDLERAPRHLAFIRVGDDALECRFELNPL